jgi:hypothetical protein
MSAEQIQCPNCGGFETIDVPKNMTGSQGKVAEQLPESNGFLIFAAVLQCLMFLVCFGMAVLTAMNVTIDKKDIPSALAVFALGMIFSAGSLWFTIRQLIQPRHLQNEHVPTTRHFFECRSCGYKWDWSAGQPVQRSPADPN